MIRDNFSVFNLSREESSVIVPCTLLAGWLHHGRAPHRHQEGPGRQHRNRVPAGGGAGAVCSTVQYSAV